MIPKVIYQTFHSKILPYNIQNLINEMLSNNPDYEYCIYDDEDIENFIMSEFDDKTYQAFKMLNVGAAKADFWRYCILYKKGGVYLDIDSSITGKLDQLIKEDDKAILSRETHKDMFLQWCLIFDKDHPILEICINKCVENILNKKNENIIHLTGPIVLSDSVFEYCENIQKIWETDDNTINSIIKSNNLDLRLYSVDFYNFCVFKNKYEHELGEFNILNNRPKHWSEEKKIFK